MDRVTFNNNENEKGINITYNFSYFNELNKGTDHR